MRARDSPYFWNQVTHNLILKPSNPQIKNQKLCHKDFQTKTIDFLQFLDFSYATFKHYGSIN